MSRAKGKCRLMVRAENDRFVFQESYPTYARAISGGQRHAGWGNFYIETGGRVPSREEQLGKSSKEAILDML